MEKIKTQPCIYGTTSTVMRRKIKPIAYVFKFQHERESLSDGRINV